MNIREMNLKSSNGQYLLKPLFWETSTKSSREKFKPLYTLKEDDYVDSEGNEYKSVYKIYMSCTDEYEAANKIVGSMYHWEKLCATKWFMEGASSDTGVKLTMGLDDWRRHKIAEEESTAKAGLLKLAESGNVTALKYLHEHTVPKKKRGKKEHDTRNTADDELSSNIAQFQARDRSNG